MTATAKALLHRRRQVRSTVLRAELALTAAQVLFWTALIAVPAGLVLLARRRSHSGPAPWGSPAAGAHPSPRPPAPAQATGADSNSQGHEPV